MNIFDALCILADRPKCEHNLNGPCRECGRGLTLDEAVTWQQELHDLGVEPRADTA